jgi:Hypoxia induced protein conserved region
MSSEESEPAPKIAKEWAPLAPATLFLIRHPGHTRLCRSYPLYNLKATNFQTRNDVAAALRARDGLIQVLVLEGGPMSEFMSHYLVPAAIIAVAIVLLLGLINMMRGGSPNRSQKLMRLRVLLQFVAIIVIMATIWAMGR